MSSSNRGDRIQLLQKVLKKHYKPAPISEGRTVLEHLLFACMLEDAPYEAAEEVFQRLPEMYVDYNEVRVTTVTELADAIRTLPDPTAAAARIKRTLQAIFETRYSFDLEDMRKMNQGKAIQELAKFSGVSRFVVAYVTQYAFGGHTVPVSDSIMHLLLMTGIVTQTEADKHQTPGLERAITKSKGHEFSSCLHQMAAEFRVNPSGKNIKAILKEAGGVEMKTPERKPAPPARASSVPKITTGKPEPAKPATKVATKDTKDSKDTKESKAKETKEVKAVKPPAKPAKDSKTGKPTAADTKKPAATQKPTVTKKSLPPKKPTKTKGAAPAAAKKPVVKKLTSRKPK